MPLKSSKHFLLAKALLVIIAIAVGALWIFNAMTWRRQAQSYSGHPDGSIQFVTVEPGVRVEVVDFGGTGRPVVLLAGYNGTAHDFGRFAVELTLRYHVYGITRRGWDAGCTPCRGYSAHQLGADVVAVIDSLKLSRPVLIGSSFAGEEMSSVANEHPDKIAGAVYLDAGETYALYDEKDGSRQMDVARRVKWLTAPIPAELLPRIISMTAGMEKFTTIPVPVLAIFAEPHDLGSRFKDDPARLAKTEAVDADRVERQASAFERQVKICRVIRIPHASHLIFKSNEEEVLRAILEFVSGLPAANPAGLAH